MINLLPPEAKKELAAGRANRLLLRYQILFGVLALVAISIMFFFYTQLENSKQSYQQTVDSNMKKTSTMANSRKDVAEFRNNLNIASQILGSQVNYSTIFIRVASVIPPEVILSELTLDSETVNQPVKLSAYAKNEQAVLNLKDAINSSKYFTNAYFDAVSREGDTYPEYPISVTMTVTFTEEIFND